MTAEEAYHKCGEAYNAAQILSMATGKELREVISSEPFTSAIPIFESLIGTTQQVRGLMLQRVGLTDDIKTVDDERRRLITSLSDLLGIEQESLVGLRPNPSIGG